VLENEHYLEELLKDEKELKENILAYTSDILYMPLELSEFEAMNKDKEDLKKLFER